jgi:D-alanyl-D-alanine carboxypeptidase
MSSNYYRPNGKRVKLRYKNIALLLAVLMLIIVLITASCNAVRNGRKDNDSDDKGAVSGDQGMKPDDDGIIRVTLPTNPADQDNQGNVSPNPAGTVPDPTDQRSYVFDFVNKTQADLGVGNLVLVNNRIKFLGSVDENKLVIVHDQKNKAYWVSDRNVKLLPVAMDALNSMLLDFKNATQNGNVMARSGYRTIEYQEQLYNEDLAKNGADSSTLVAMPGYSEHHTGLVVDFTTYDGKSYDDFTGEGDYAWIMNNCDKYGFINRYPAGKEKLTFIDNEPWHFRYVGVPHASIMKDYGYCMEEYIDFIKNYTIDTSMYLKEMPNGAKYLVYYVPMVHAESTAIYFPLKEDPLYPDDTSKWQPYPYEISGNNVDGFIVTVTLQEGTKPTPAASTVTGEPAGDNTGNTENGGNNDGTAE